MTELEALGLYDYIRDEIKMKKRLKPELHTLGNGEHVIKVRDVFMWSESDWDSLKHEWKQYLKSNACRDIASKGDVEATKETNKELIRMHDHLARCLLNSH